MRRPAALLALAFTLALVAATPAAANGGTTQRCNGSAQLCDRPLEDVVLPATHNAMSAASLGWRFPNQQVGIPDQLRAGVRGLLIDTYYGERQLDGSIRNAERGTLYLCHTRCELGATRLIDVLREIRRFLERNPDEVLVIVNEQHVTAAAFAKEVRRSGLSRHVYRGRPGPRWPTLARMIATRQQVVLLSEASETGVPWYHPMYEGIVQETPYTWATEQELTDPDRLRESCRPNRGGTTGSLFLMNHWSPPFNPNESTSRRVNSTSALVRRARACRERRGKLPNLVAVDLFRAGGLFTAVRKLNADAG